MTAQSPAPTCPRRSRFRYQRKLRGPRSSATSAAASSERRGPAPSSPRCQAQPTRCSACPGSRPCSSTRCGASSPPCRAPPALRTVRDRPWTPTKPAKSGSSPPLNKHVLKKASKKRSEIKRRWPSVCWGTTSTSSASYRWCVVAAGPSGWPPGFFPRRCSRAGGVRLRRSCTRCLSSCPGTPCCSASPSTSSSWWWPSR
ncbi:hypothetical protein EGW08_016159 [Elysia chlorotica]|uniref:Uncharacterized protein n=1 Tax=Elysia chlorotica TaxID=188477 RepID=A0A433T3E5_ELYCH|nr:hypothetical protein EGW08_016159 [Elysia chlorotica]